MSAERQIGHALRVDDGGVPEVIRRTREVLRMGATQVKAMAGGGATSLYDPLDVTEYTLEEMKAIVAVAKSWNTYVAVHVNTDAAIRQWIEAGALSMEHGFLKFENPISTAKYEQCVSGLNEAVAAARKYNVETGLSEPSIAAVPHGKLLPCRGRKP